MKQKKENKPMHVQKLEDYTRSASSDELTELVKRGALSAQMHLLFIHWSHQLTEQKNDAMKKSRL